MKSSNTAKETIHHIIDEAKEEKKLDQKLVLLKTKEDLLKLHEDVSYASVVLKELQKTNWIDKATYDRLETKLRNNETKKEATSEIASIIDGMHTKYDTLQGGEKERANSVAAALDQSKYSLSGLKNEVLDKANTEDYYATIQTKIDEKVDKQFAGRRYEGFAGSYKKHLHEKINELKVGKDKQEKSIRETIKSSAADWFFGLVGTLTIGKNVADLISEEVATYKDKIVELGDEGKELADKAKEAIVNTPEQLKEKEKNLRNYIKVLVGKYDKKIDDPTLDRVMKRIDIKKIASENTPEIQKLLSSNWEDANVAKSVLQGASVFALVGVELVQALQSEGVISYGDMAYEAVGNTIQYGLKGFKLVGTGMKVICGQISTHDLTGEMKKLYEKSPDAARELIWAIMYRTQHSPIFKFALNTATLMGKTALWPLLEAKDDIKSLNHITDGLHGHMTTAVNEIEEFAKYLPEGQGEMNRIVSELKSEANSLKEMNQIQIIEREMHAYGKNTTIDLAAMQKEYIRKTGASSSYLESLQNPLDGKPLDTHGFASKMQARTELVGKTVASDMKAMTKLQKAGNNIGKITSALQFKPNEISMVEEGIQRLESTSKSLSTMMNHRGMLAPMSDAVSGMRGGLVAMKETFNADKAYFNFRTAEDFEQFMKKAKFIAKQSPETLKFMIGKMPIFLVGGMALGADGTMSEKMKALGNDLRALVPIVGPILILADASNAGKLVSGDPETRGQMGLGAVLITSDVYKIGRYALKSERAKLGRYMIQPVVDVAEITAFAANATKNSIILTKDFVNVAKTKSAMQLGEAAWSFMKTGGRLSRLGAMTALVAGGYFTWDYLFSSNDIDQKTKDQLAKYKDNPDELDKDIEAGWSTMKQEERNDYIKAGIIRQGGFSPEKIGKLDVKFDQAANTYTAVLPSVISYDQVIALKSSLQDSLGRVQSGTQVKMQFLGEARYQFTKDLSTQFADIPAADRIAKMEEYVHAMGYENAKIVLDEENIS